MSIENFEHIEKLWPGQDVFIHCNGNVLFEDFEHKLQSELLLDNFLLDTHNAVNDFKRAENRDLLGYVLQNKSQIASLNDILMQIDMKFYLPVHFVMSLIEILNSFIKSSVAGILKLTVGNTGNDVQKINIDKVKADTRKEVQCTGKLVFHSNRECLVLYENLGFRLENGFFKYPNTASPDIFIMNSTDLHLRGHCFVAENDIDKNIAEMIKAFQESIYGAVTVKIDGKEQVFKKQQSRYFSKNWGRYYW